MHASPRLLWRIHSTALASFCSTLALISRSLMLRLFLHGCLVDFRTSVLQWLSGYVSLVCFGVVVLVVLPMPVLAWIHGYVSYVCFAVVVWLLVLGSHKASFLQCLHLDECILKLMHGVIRTSRRNRTRSASPFEANFCTQYTYVVLPLCHARGVGLGRHSPPVVVTGTKTRAFSMPRSMPWMTSFSRRERRTCCHPSNAQRPCVPSTTWRQCPRPRRPACLAAVHRVSGVGGVSAMHVLSAQTIFVIFVMFALLLVVLGIFFSSLAGFLV